jgi:oxalate decarboxylase/phosphoglucose isomerase-like protein (cupin superfamily)
LASSGKYDWKSKRACSDRLQAEWGFVYAGEVLVSAVDENGDYQVDKLQVGDIWYFPKGSAHTIQGARSAVSLKHMDLG